MRQTTKSTERFKFQLRQLADCSIR